MLRARRRTKQAQNQRKFSTAIWQTGCLTVCLERYRRSDAVLAEVMSGIILYFDKALGNNLLYRFERAQYVDIRRKTAEARPMSEIYGAEHLLRLFGKSRSH